MNFDDQQEALLALRESRQWVQRAYDEAEAQHDTYGDTYGDPGLYEVMQETGKLMARIDALLVPNLVITPSEPA